jgi:DNA end-binding protein Ku
MLRPAKEVERRDLLKGYEFHKNKYVLLSDEEFDSVRMESLSVMTIEKLVETDTIDPVYYDAAYYLAPDGDAGRDT